MRKIKKEKMKLLANNKTFSVDASAQVAHAISTHAIESEFDFFTAVDDLQKEDSTGAGMLGTIEFNSSTLYRYANIALHELHKQLGNKEDAIHATKLFIKTFIESMPTGMINSFANHTIPQAVVVTLRSDRPVNMVSAFEEPIKSENGFVNPSIVKLFDTYTKYDRVLEKPIFTGYFLFDDIKVKQIGQAEENVEALIEDVAEKLERTL